MRTIMWQKRRILLIVIISILCYTMFRKKHYSYQSEVIIGNVKAETVWEFVADFSNIKKYLVPLIRNFTILEESGNYDHWKYSVSYEEPLPVWPYLNSFGVGRCSVKADGGQYLVSAVHKTCFFYGWACSTSTSNLFMKQINKQDTKYREDIVYECPPAFSSWCYRVVAYTRKDFIDNLVNYYKIHE